MRAIFTILLSLIVSINVFAQPSVATRATVDNAISGDNVLRFYRLAIPVTNSAFVEDFNSDYNEVLEFWQDCEEFVNKVFVPLGFCFDVVENQSLVMNTGNLIDESIYYATSYGTELADAAIGSSAYDIAMWVTYRPAGSENTGLSVQNGAYSNSTKGSGYAQPDKWVVAHEIGHLFGATHTLEGEGSLMDNEGEYFSLQSIKEIRTACMQHNSAYYSDKELTALVGANNGGNYVYGIKVDNQSPLFDTGKMKDKYIIPQGACLSIGLFATDKDNDKLSYMSLGDVVTIDYIECQAFASLPPQESNVVDYSPKFSADVYDPGFFYPVVGTDMPALAPGRYAISLLVNDVQASGKCDYETMLSSPFYSNYAVWNATIEIVGGAEFKASLSPAKDSYVAGENVTVKWGVNSSYFTVDSRLRITMSANYGRSFDYVLAESVPALNGSCDVAIPNVNVGNVDVDFITAVHSMPGGIIRVEEIGGSSYTLTALSPQDGGSFNVTGGVDAETGMADVKTENKGTLYDLQGRRVENTARGLYIINGKKYLNSGK